MSKGRQKRVNPNKVPVSKDKINEAELIAEASTGNMYFAWLQILPNLVEMPGMTRKKIVELWHAGNDYAMEPRPANMKAGEERILAERLMGLRMPHPGIDLDRIRTRGDLLAVKRKLKEDARYSALCIICLGLKKTGLLSDDEIRHLFFNADITLAEIQSGSRSYEELAKDLQEKHIILIDSNEDMMIVEDDEQELKWKKCLLREGDA